MALAGHTGDATGARAGLEDPEPKVRATALGALARLGRLDAPMWSAAVADAAPEVRARACELAARSPVGTDPTVVAAVAARVGDSDTTVAEAACFALGELGAAAPPAVLSARLALVAGSHTDALVREAAVAALGAIGDPSGLPTILAATTDKPAVRRRAVLALASYDGPDVDAALTRALTDRDWQVRQAAEDLGAEDLAADVLDAEDLDAEDSGGGAIPAEEA